jgi:hypothetical protein
VWDSVEYAESVTANPDARGKTKDGAYRRYRGTIGDSCAYSKVDLAAATAFDCLLDPPKGN